MRKLGLVLFALPMFLSAGCGPGGPDKAATADTIYFDGRILTMNDAQPGAEAVAVKDEALVAA